MKNQISKASGWPVLMLVVLLMWSSCDDTVTLNNHNEGEEIGLLSDGQGSAAFINDKTQVGPLNLFSVGKYTSGVNNEAIAFTNLRPVAIKQNIAWTDGDDAIEMDFQNKITIPVTCWIVKGPFATSRTNAVNMCINTSNIWNSERMGVDFSPFQIIDATGDADASDFFDFDCSMQADIKSDIGNTAGRINIYVVETVDGGAGRGQACQIGSDFVAIATTAGTELLSHEIGHNFDLRHIDGQASFNTQNVMHSASSSRQYLTEGQLFRAHLGSASALNDTYNARPGQPTRECAHGASSNTCVTLNKRIWADGGLSAN